MKCGSSGGASLWELNRGGDGRDYDSLGGLQGQSCTIIFTGRSCIET